MWLMPTLAPGLRNVGVIPRGVVVAVAGKGVGPARCNAMVTKTVKAMAKEIGKELPAAHKMWDSSRKVAAILRTAGVVVSALGSMRGNQYPAKPGLHQS